MKLSKLCNLRCTYCYEFDELGDRDRMALEDVERFFSGLAADHGDRPWPHLRFVLHGGEPTLLPLAYLERFAELQRRHLGEAGITYETSLQTNLVRLDERLLEFLERERISLGISLDVFGAERRFVSGRESQERVLANLQRLIDTGADRRLGVGIISVLHRGNVDRAAATFRFCAELGYSYRILPVFSLGEPPPRMRHLTITHDEVVQALQAVARAQFESSSSISVYPLANYLEAAASRLMGIPVTRYDPAEHEWALIVNTNGDVYNHGDAYEATGLMGNVFRAPLRAILAGPGRERVLAVRAERASVCAACPHDGACSRLPLVEALPSERAYDHDGELRCAIARPMIDFMVDELRNDPEAAGLLDRVGASVKLGAPA